jgi:ABC-2 type transport system ATP-binding protein
MVGLGSARNRPVGEFSKGMARRIGLAQALINDPEVVILDEPTSGLDPIGCREVKDVIKLLASRGKTVIMCSHLLADVEDVCDQVAVLYGGRICAQGGLTEMLAIENKTRIVTPRLETGTLQKVLDLLREAVAAGELQVDNPSMNLEQFFLDVVRKAREASMETAGAQAGGEIADYLRVGATAAGEGKGAEILSSLADTGKSAETQATPAPEAAPAPAPAPIAQEKLAELTGPEPEISAEEAVAEPAQPAAGKETAAEEPSSLATKDASAKLKKLLGGDGE